MENNHIEQFIQDLDQQIQDVISNSIRHRKELILGINHSQVEGALFQINKHLKITNEVFDLFVKIFPEVEKSLGSFLSELVPIMSSQKSDIPIQLRKRYVVSRNINIPKYFKLEKVLFSIDYEPGIEDAFEAIVALLGEWSSTKLEYYDVERFWNPETLRFECSDMVRDDLNNRHTVYANDQYLVSAISLLLITGGLSSLDSLLDDATVVDQNLISGANPDTLSQRFKALIEIISSKVVEIDSSLLKAKGDSFIKTERSFAINWNELFKGIYDREFNTFMLNTSIEFKSVDPTPDLNELQIPLNAGTI